VNTTPFHSTNEVKKPLNKRRYHDQANCGAGRTIPADEHEAGTKGYKLCEQCHKIKKK